MDRTGGEEPHLGHQGHSQPGPEEHRRNRGGRKLHDGRSGGGEDPDKGKLVASATGTSRKPAASVHRRAETLEPRHSAVPLRHGSVAQAGRKPIKVDSYTAMSQDGSQRATRAAHPPHDAQRQTAAPLRPARPGLVAPANFHRTDRRSAAVRHSDQCR